MLMFYRTYFFYQNQNAMRDLPNSCGLILFLLWVTNKNTVIFQSICVLKTV